MLRMLGEEQGSCIILITLVSIAAVVIRLLVGIKVPHERQEHEVCLCLRATLLTFGVNQVFSRWNGKKNKNPCLECVGRCNGGHFNSLRIFRVVFMFIFCDTYADENMWNYPE